jgi:hypothetical protein
MTREAGKIQVARSQSFTCLVSREAALSCGVSGRSSWLSLWTRKTSDEQKKSSECKVATAGDSCDPPPRGGGEISDHRDNEAGARASNGAPTSNTKKCAQSFHARAPLNHPTSATQHTGDDDRNPDRRYRDSRTRHALPARFPSAHG